MASLPKEKNYILWAGHNTFLIRIQGELWIIDPIFSERVIITKRETPPALGIEDLSDLSGPINIVITHNHPDHCDRKSIQKLPGRSRVYVPLGLGSFIRKLDKTHVYEMDWWEEVDFGNRIRLVCLPSQHWSQRIEQERDTTLWANFLLITPDATIFIGGDNGYFIGFREIGGKYPGIDYTLMSVSAYHPRWLMYYSHMNMEEAIMAQKDLGAKHFILGHWGSFQLGDEPVGYPAVDLKRLEIKLSLEASRYHIMNIGEIMVVPKR